MGVFGGFGGFFANLRGGMDKLCLSVFSVYCNTLHGQTSLSMPPCGINNIEFSMHLISRQAVSKSID